MSGLRICLVYDCLFPWTVGGAERWYRTLGERLARDGHDVTYVTLRQWPRSEPPRLPGVRVVPVGPHLGLYTESGRRRILPPLVFGLGVLWHLLRHGRRYDVVHTCSFPYFSLLAIACARVLHRFGLVVDWFEFWTRSYWDGYLGRVGGRIGWAVQALCARVPQRAFAFAAMHAARLRAHGGLRGSVTVLRGLYSGEFAGDSSFRPPAPAASPPVAVFAGRHIPEKRVPAFVPALAVARADGAPSLVLDVYGDGPDRALVEAAAASAGMETSVRVLGFVDASAVDSALQHRRLPRPPKHPRGLRPDRRRSRRPRLPRRRRRPPRQRRRRARRRRRQRHRRRVRFTRRPRRRPGTRRRRRRSTPRVNRPLVRRARTRALARGLPRRRRRLLRPPLANPQRSNRPGRLEHLVRDLTQSSRGPGTWKPPGATRARRRRPSPAPRGPR